MGREREGGEGVSPTPRYHSQVPWKGCKLEPLEKK